MSFVDIIPKELWFPAFALFLLFLVLAFVPKDRIRELFPTCLIWGVIGSILFNSTAHGLGLFKHHFIEPFTLLGTPLWLTMAWPMGTMLFLHFRPKGRLKYVFYLVSFGTVASGIDAIFHGLGLMTFYLWSPLARFFMALIWFGGVTVLYDRLMSR